MDVSDGRERAAPMRIAQHQEGAPSSRGKRKEASEKAPFGLPTNLKLDRKLPAHHTTGSEQASAKQNEAARLGSGCDIGGCLEVRDPRVRGREG